MAKGRLPFRNFIVSVFFSSLIAGLVSFQSTQVGAQSNTFDNDVAQSIKKLSKCYMRQDMQPTLPIEMNTVSIKQTVRILYAENETYVCKTQSNLPIIVDVVLYARLTDDIRTQTPVNRTLEIVSCISDLNLTGMKCISERPHPNLPPLEVKCSINKYQRPVLMNTDIVSSNVTHGVHSVEAHSRMFTCRDQDDTQMFKEIVTFTKMYEDLDKMITKKNVESLICMKTIVNLKVLACSLQKVM
jgi:hypothetical protein